MLLLSLAISDLAFGTMFGIWVFVILLYLSSLDVCQSYKCVCHLIYFLKTPENKICKFCVCFQLGFKIVNDFHNQILRFDIYCIVNVLGHWLKRSC